MSTIASVKYLFQSFIPGFRLVDGGELSQFVDLMTSVSTGITAHAGGGQTGATVLPSAFNSVDTCASDNDSTALPQAIPGKVVWVKNNTAHTLAVFGIVFNPVTGVGDTIVPAGSNTAAATGTGVTQATAKIDAYICLVAGVWQQGGLATS